MKCPRCDSNNIVKNGFKQLKNSKVQKYQCRDCDKYFTGEEKFHHLNDVQKAEVFALLNKGIKIHHIAKKLGVYLRTIQYLINETKKTED